MEESRDMLMKTLEKSGVSIPGDVSSIGEFSPDALVLICAQLLNLLDRTSLFSTELPDSVADRFRICTDIALAVKNLGYIGDISYYKFLYPSEEDSYKLVRFLAERLTETNVETKPSDINVAGSPRTVEDNVGYTSDDKAMKDDTETFDMHIQKVEAVLKDLKLSAETSLSFETRVRDTLSNWSVDDDLSSWKMDDPGISESLDLSLRLASGNEETRSPLHGDCILESTNDITSDDSSSKVRCETVKLQNQEKLLLEELKSGSLELHNLDEEMELLKAATERDDVRLRLETKKLSLINHLYADKPEAQEKLQKLGEIELEIKSVSSVKQMREEERCKLHSELEKQLKAAPRKSYIQRIKEITKNSRKLDSDIQRILKETRELQLESNSIQERLHRAYAVVDEMVLREAKKDPSVRQIYKLLANIHGIFEQTSEKILVTDRLGREAAEHEKKLQAIAAQGMSLEKLQADLDAIKRENELLENELNQV
ncbi:PREDICTED: coiled-coil domain-containing protein 22 isoform X2 [Tarenaya hassleriana]|uniref:coiled-coil domain-containing protein 22 isoform X2 n=1 Tax=Tarenaya hassleriana TaxID=28532 RepID=UPI00053C35A9|nr:PREDICTED: coiled-coil domain-containing protein 22 isoform X2 [Tarenaya hassleriana]